MQNSANSGKVFDIGFPIVRYFDQYSIEFRHHYDMENDDF